MGGRKRVVKKTPKISKGMKLILGIGLALILLFLLKLSMAKAWSETLGMSFGVVDKEGVAVVYADTGAKRLVIWRLPKNLMVPVPAMKGTLQAGSLWRFGEDEGKPTEILVRSLEMFLGVKLDGVIYEPNLELGSGFNLRILQPQKSSLWVGDRLRLMLFLSSLRGDQVRVGELPVSKGKKLATPDGREILELDTKRLDNVRADWANLAVSNGRGRVEIKGDVSEASLLLAERMVGAVGGLVVEVGKSEDKTKRCEVGVSEELRDDGVVMWIQKKLGCKVKNQELVKGQIELVLGEEWEKRYSKTTD